MEHSRGPAGSTLVAVRRICERTMREIAADRLGAAASRPKAGYDLDTIESRAEDALSRVPGWLWDGASLPVPVDSIADSHFCLLVREVTDMGAAPGFPEVDPAHLSGLLLTALGEIWVNADEARQWPARRRFTIGHELGHWVMHRSGQQSLFCRHVTGEGEVPGQLSLEQDAAAAPARLDSEAQSRPSIPPEEEEANAFSAALLMPRDLFAAEHRRVRGDVARLQERFDCSEKATLRRIEAVLGG